MDTKAKDREPIKDMLAGFVTIINRSPERAECVRRRVPELLAEPFPTTPGDNTLQVAVFKAAAEYHAHDPKPRTEFAACPNQLHCTNPGEFPPAQRWGLPCGRAARIYRSGSDEKPDMAYCEHCRRWFVVNADTQRTQEQEQEQEPAYDWFNY